jgi:hypothetical protein
MSVTIKKAIPKLIRRNNVVVEPTTNDSIKKTFPKLIRRNVPKTSVIKTNTDDSMICDIICSIWEQIEPYLSYFSKINLHMVRKDLSDALKKAGKIPQPLYVYQIPHFKNMLRCLDRYCRAIDTSEPGLGKTYITSFLAYVTNKALIVFGPEQVRGTWTDAAKFYGITDFCFLSYGVLLRRTKPIPFISKNQYGEYHPNQNWLDLTDSGVHLAFDEVHWLRTDSKRSMIASIIAQAAIESGNSNVTYLSGSLLENNKQCYPYLKLLGLAPISDDVNHIDELQNNAEELFDDDEYIPPDPIGIFKGPVYDNLRHAMEPIPRKMVACNYFMDVGQNLNHINAGINALEDAINQHEAEHYITLLVNIECSKSKTYVRLIREKLKKHPNNKVIIMLNYTRPLKYIAKKLAIYDPIVIDGKVKPLDRPALLAKFQKPTTEHRLLVANINVTGEGIGLDDLDGNFPRFLFLSPGNSLTKLQQAMRRVDRGPRTQSKAKVKILYADGAEKEMTILGRLNDKSLVMGESLGYDTVLPNKLPHKYELEHE